MKIALDTPRGTPAVVDADTVAALIAVLAAAQTGAEPAPDASQRSRWRAAARAYEPYDA